MTFLWWPYIRDLTFGWPYSRGLTVVPLQSGLRSIVPMGFDGLPPHRPGQKRSLGGDLVTEQCRSERKPQSRVMELFAGKRRLASRFTRPVRAPANGCVTVRRAAPTKGFRPVNHAGTNPLVLCAASVVSFAAVSSSNPASIHPPPRRPRCFPPANWKN